MARAHHSEDAGPARFHEGSIRCEAEFGVFANAPDAYSAGRNLFQHRGVGVAAVESEKQDAFVTAGIVIERLAELDHLPGAQAEAGRTCIQPVLGHLSGVALRSGFCGAACRKAIGFRRNASSVLGMAPEIGGSAGRARSWFGSAGRADRGAIQRPACGGRTGVSSESSRTARNGAPAGSRSWRWRGGRRRRSGTGARSLREEAGRWCPNPETGKPEVVSRPVTVWRPRQSSELIASVCARSATRC